MSDRIDQAVVPATGVVGRREFVASFAAGMIAMLATSKVVSQDALAPRDRHYCLPRGRWLVGKCAGHGGA